MRILFYSSIFPRPWDATRGIYCYHACRAMADLGHAVRVVSPRSWLERARGHRVEPLAEIAQLDVQYPKYFYPPGLLRGAYDQFMWASTRRSATGVMQELRPHCVLSYWAHPDGAVAARIARAAGIPSAIIVGGSDVLVLARRPGARRRSVTRALLACDAVITVGRDLADAVIRLGVPTQKVHVVYQGIDRGLFSPGSREDSRRRLEIPQEVKVLTFVGGLLPIKGVDVLLQALGLLQRNGNTYRLYIIGDGPSAADLRAQVTQLRLTGLVTFVGRVEQRGLPDWYRAADLTVLPSRSEGVPNVLRESLACGTAFVATRVGGVHEIATGTANRLVPPDDPTALADAIAASAGGQRTARAESTLQTWTQSARQLVEVLTPLVARAGQGRHTAIERPMEGRQTAC